MCAREGGKADTHADVAAPRRGKDSLPESRDAEVTPPLAPLLASTPGGGDLPPISLSPPALPPSAAMGELRLDWTPTLAHGFANSFSLPVPPPVSPRSSTSSCSHADSPFHPPPPGAIWTSRTAWPSEDSRLSGCSDPSLTTESERESEREADGDSMDEVGEMLRCNATTGAVEIAMPPGVDKQASHHTVSVRRQISQLFEDDPMPELPPKTPKHKFWFSDGVWSGGVNGTPIQGISLF